MRLAGCGAESEWPALASSVALVCGARSLGAVFVVAGDDTGSERDQVADFAVKLALAVPAIAVALCVGPGSRLAARIHAGQTRTMAVLREGAIALRQLGRDEIESRLRATAAARVPDLDGSIGRLARDGCTSSMIDRFVEAAAEVEPACAETADRARSAAERFLFARLDSLPETAGEFELNGRLEQRFGVAAAEIDLLARGLSIAIEVDGYYHFQDADAYRRDRRKDVFMQRRGLLVIRVLAADVVEHIDDILDTILHLVRARRAEQYDANGAR